ncbi:CinA family protein [Prevotella sp. OH937_COT-195]|uniref:CinA family protein n=1 Tax=Prevotella sp. OH937_COT-195 TaxID=2491051 RepID=UPI000F64D87E|nr:CinA family protein [Prevotella sp. OH937_COT-195]RRD02993.1 CinA family protein [Prevotella sp. OH937_COT-195]
MELENRILSREIHQLLYEKDFSLGTAESCTGGKIAEAIIAAPGASHYFKGSIVSYADEVKVRLLNVAPQLIEEKNAVSEEVAKAMVEGACDTLNVDYAVAATGFAGPGGGTNEIPVGTIYVACGTKGDVVTMKITGDEGRDPNISNATNQALQLLLKYLAEKA